MSQTWKRWIYETPPQRSVRWMFLVLSILFTGQALLLPPPGPFGRIVWMLLGLMFFLRFTIESLPPTKQRAVGNARMLTILPLLVLGVIMIANGVIVWNNPMGPW